MIGFILIQILVMSSGELFPVGVEESSSLFLRTPIFGLLYFNTLDIFAFTRLGLILLAICVALRNGRESTVDIAAFLAVIGTAVFISERVIILAAAISLDTKSAAAAPFGWTRSLDRIKANHNFVASKQVNHYENNVSIN